VTGLVKSIDCRLIDWLTTDCNTVLYDRLVAPPISLSFLLLLLLLLLLFVYSLLSQVTCFYVDNFIEVYSAVLVVV